VCVYGRHPVDGEPFDAIVREVRRGVEDGIESGGVFDFLGHPACLQRNRKCAYSI
jgi:hypothetical protein